MIDVDRFRADVESARSQGYECVTIPTCHYANLLDEIERLREKLRKAVELLNEAAPRFVSYEECMDWQDQGEDCIAKDGHWEHELRTKMDEFVERNKETK